MFSVTNNKDCQSVNFTAAEAINSYVSNGYRIDAQESVVDPHKDKNCTFKTVLKKEVDNSNYKVVIKIFNYEDDSNTICSYSRVETIDNIKWSEETRSFSLRKYSTDKSACSKFKRLHDVIKATDNHEDKINNESVDDTYVEDIYSEIVKYFQ